MSGPMHPAPVHVSGVEEVCWLLWGPGLGACKAACRSPRTLAQASVTAAP